MNIHSLFFISTFLTHALSLKPVFLIAGFENSPIYSKISNPSLYPECPSGKHPILIKDHKNFNTNFLLQYPYCVAKLFRVELNSKTGKLEQLPGITTESISIGDPSFFSDTFGSIFSKIKEIGYQANKNFFGVSYNHFLHPVTSYSVFYKLKNKIEQVYSQTGEKSIFISFDQGSNFISMFLSDYSKSEWVSKYIDSVIFLSPTFAGLPSLSNLYSQNFSPFISNSEIKKSMMRMPGFLMSLPNYAIYENFSFDGKYKRYNVSESFEILKELRKVDDESEKIFKTTVEKHLKTAIPEPPISSLIIINDKTAQTVIKPTISIDDTDRHDESVLISAKYACSRWKSVKCIHSNKPSQIIFEYISGRTFKDGPLLMEAESGTTTVNANNHISGKNVEGIYANSGYVTSHSVSTSEFTYTGPVGMSRYPLTYAFDGNPKTFFASSVNNSDTYNDTIEITFNEPISLEAIIIHASYGAGTITGALPTFHGFPILFCAYTSLDNSPYELAAVFETNPAPPTAFQFVLPNLIKCDKLKLEFADVTIQTASYGNGPAKNLIIGELIFIRHLFISGESIYSNVGYTKTFFVPNSELTFSGSEGMPSYPISNAFDDKSDTYYISNTANSDTHKNFIEISFKKTETLEGFVYDPVISTVGGQDVFHGYPTVMNIYSSVGTDPYSLKMKFKGPCNPSWTRVCFHFSELITCDKLKIEFVEVTHQTIVGNSTNPAISNLYFNRYMNAVKFTKSDFNYRADGYIHTYMVDSSKYVYSGDEGQAKYPLSNAFDNDPTTFYIPNEINNKDHYNQIFINFTETVSLTHFFYDLAYLTTSSARVYYGYPSVVIVYKSLGNEPFTLCKIFYGEAATPMYRLQFHFQETVKCDKLRLEFINVMDQRNLTAESSYLCICNLYFMPEHVSNTVQLDFASDKYNNDTYVDSIKVNNSEFTFTIDKAKDGFPESNIFDGDKKTFYIASTVMNLSYHSELEVTFQESVFLEAFLYDPEGYTDNPQIAYFSGFPTGIKVYTSINNQPYELNTFFVGLPIFPNARIQYVFPDFIECDKLKFEFVHVMKQRTGTKASSLSIGNLFLLHAQIPATSTPMPTFTASQSPSKSPSPSPSFSPSISPTEEFLPTQIPITDVCEKGSHCSYEGSLDNPVLVTINMSLFSSIQSNENGGAILLKNAGLVCTSISFSNCKTNSDGKEGDSSSSGGGGGICIMNDIEMNNSVSIKEANFTKCKAGYGGAVFIYSKSISSKISILDCYFASNEATFSSSQTSKTSGGSAIFITTKSSFISDCVFFKNIGENQVKIENQFSQSQDEEQASLLSQEQQKAKTTNIIRFCKFNIERHSKSSLSYLGGINGVSCQVLNSVFVGDLNPGCFHINGQVINKLSPKLVIVRCKFSSDHSNAFDTRNDKEYIFIQLEKQSFNYDEAEEEEENSGSSLDAIDYALIAAVPVLVIIIIIIVKKQCDLMKMGKAIKE